MGDPAAVDPEMAAGVVDVQAADAAAAAEEADAEGGILELRLKAGMPAKE